MTGPADYRIGAVTRRAFTAGLGLLVAVGPMPVRASPRLPEPSRQALDAAVARARSLDRLRSLIVSIDGEVRVAEAFGGPGLDAPANVKSVAKTIFAALTGAAIDRGILGSVDQKVVPVLGDLVPKAADPRVGEITVDHLLTMRAGLERTSGPNYGEWVQSRNWVRYALSRDFADEPGGRMLYSTGSYHILSAVLTRASGRSALALGRDWLGEPLGIEIPPWTRDPQGFYMGGNNMALTPMALLKFGEMYRRGGIGPGGRVLSEDWVRASWTPRTRSPFSNDDYGYGWFIRTIAGHPIRYARGYGGQMLYVVPDIGLTVVVTSDPTRPARSGGYVGDLHALMEDHIIPAAERVG